VPSLKEIPELGPGAGAEETDDLEAGWDEVRRTMEVEVRTRLRFRRCRLRVTGGPQDGREIVSDKERVAVGTHPASDLALDDATASRHHCEIRYTERGYHLVDLKSTNGTYLDGKRVEGAFLSGKATLTVGMTPIVFEPLDEEIDVEPESAGVLGGMVGHSLRMRQIFGLLRKIGPMDISVVIQGETGTGKELCARAIHDLGRRAGGPFVVIDCGAVPPTLIESELFGHEKGAFTGATALRIGAFERANGGTVFLDEIGELRIDLQPKLLRVLQSRQLSRVGGNKVIPVDVRVIAATNRDLAREMSAGRFREDLFFRLSVVGVQLPPLRQRVEDIPHIVQSVLDDPENVRQHGQKRLTSRALAVLVDYAWPGNVRELINVIQHALALADGTDIDVAQLPPYVLGQIPTTKVPFKEHLPFKKAREELLSAFERDYLASTLKRCQGNMTRAAAETGLHRKSIERLARKYGLEVQRLKRKTT
jgi:DNA-binding NtrC family response regulator